MKLRVVQSTWLQLFAAGGVGVVPPMRADHERGQDRVVGGGPSIALNEAQVPVLGCDNLGAAFERRAGTVDVGRADPIPVPDADVAVVRQDAQHGAAAVVSIAAGASDLGCVPEHLPIRCRVAQFRQRAGQVRCGSSGQRSEPVGVDDAAGGSRARCADSPPQLVAVVAVERREPGQVGGDDFVRGGWDRDRQQCAHQRAVVSPTRREARIGLSQRWAA